MADFESIKVQGEGVTLPLLIWRRFHRPMPGLAERAFDATPGLAAQGAFIAPGTIVRLPIIDDVGQSKAPQKRIQLW